MTIPRTVCIGVRQWLSTALVVLLAGAGDGLAEPVQWLVLEGGNGHYYELVPQTLTWDEAKVAAETATFMDMRGHLVTITSEAENSFIINNVFDPQTPGWIGLTDRELYGGFESLGQENPKTDGWVWVTGESVEYTNWWHAEPNDLNGEDFAVMGGSEGTPWWNDGQDHWTHAYIVEYGDATVRDVHFFYNNSALDANGPLVTEADFAAIATDKEPLRAGETARFANISGYSRGINGVFIDIDGLPADGAGMYESDFSFSMGSGSPDTWTVPDAPTSIGILPDQGEDGSDRVYITFDDGAITNAWLRLTVKGNADTNLPADQDFLFGIVPGETGASFTPGAVGSDAADLQSIARNLTPLSKFGKELVTQPNDLNRDGSVNAFDFQVVAMNLSPNVLGTAEK